MSDKFRNYVSTKLDFLKNNKLPNILKKSTKGLTTSSVSTSIASSGPTRSSKFRFLAKYFKIKKFNFIAIGLNGIVLPILIDALVNYVGRNFANIVSEKFKKIITKRNIEVSINNKKTNKLKHFIKLIKERLKLTKINRKKVIDSIKRITDGKVSRLLK